ncbi:hypothetical protein JCM6882_005399 [Rhodosporidiobolus microsporus]
MPHGYSRITQDAPPGSPPPPDPHPSSLFAPPPLGSSSSSSSSPYPPPRPVDAFAYPPPAPAAVKRALLGASRKGKERAVFPPDAEEDEEEDERGKGPAGLSFCVRFTDGQTEDLLDLWVGEKEPVKEVKRRIRLLRPSTLFASPLPPASPADPDAPPPSPPPPPLSSPRPRRLRLIQLGRLLPDGVLLVPYTVQLNAKRAALLGTQAEEETPEEKVKKSLEAIGRGVGAVVREVRERAGGDRDRGRDEADEMERGEAGASSPLLGEEKDKGKGKEKEGKGTEMEDTRVWLHCSVGEAEEEEGEGEGGKSAEGADEPSAQITPLTGFDRLLDSGFSPEDVANLRAEFRERRGIDAEDDEDDNQGEGGDGGEEHRRALEEQWMSGMTGQEEAMGDATTHGYTYSLLKGVCIGFFVPFLPLFFFRSQIFSKRMQMAIVLGIVMNLAFGLLRFLG